MGDHEAEPTRTVVLSPVVRRYVYRVALAAGPLLILYGVLSEDELATWMGLCGAVLDVGTTLLAERNVDVSADED